MPPQDADVHRTDEGIALIVTLLAVVAVSVLAAAIALTASTEVRIAANFADAIVAASAAESAVDRALVDLPPVRDWTCGSTSRDARRSPARTATAT